MTHAQRIVALEVRPVRRAEMELLAERYLRLLCPDHLITPAPLDVVRFMDRLEEPPLGIVFGVSDLPGGLEGCTLPEEREIIISPAVWEDVLRDDGRARMTCCHEAGHIQHITQVREALVSGGPLLARRPKPRVPSYRDPERQAFCVASALLMPRTTAPDVFRDGGVLAMMDIFKVTRPAAEVRVNVLRGLRCV